ncbi:MAG: hypothetical protein NT029_06635 [Armatimonadetes bacterium]|nr:hypothetical protein [Armatimonadota bacterium]
MAVRSRDGATLRVSAVSADTPAEADRLADLMHHTQLGTTPDGTLTGPKVADTAAWHSHLVGRTYVGSCRQYLRDGRAIVAVDFALRPVPNAEDRGWHQLPIARTDLVMLESVAIFTLNRTRKAGLAGDCPPTVGAPP